MNKSTQFVNCGNYVFFIKKPLLLKEEERGGQGLEGSVSLNDNSLRLVLYYNDPYMSIVVTTYFLKKNPPLFWRL